MNEVLLHLSSQDSLTEESTHSQYSFDLNNFSHMSLALMEICLEEIFFLNSHPTVNPGNQYLYFKEDGSGTILVATLPTGYYTVATLPEMIETALEDAGANSYTVTIDPTTQVMQIATTLGHSIQIVDGLDSFTMELGFTTLPSSNLQTITGASIVDLSIPAGIHIQVNLPRTSFCSGSKVINYEIPLEAGPLSWFRYEPLHPKYDLIGLSQLSVLQVAMYDSLRGKPFYLAANTEVRFRFRIRPSKNIQ